MKKQELLDAAAILKQIEEALLQDSVFTYEETPLRVSVDDEEIDTIKSARRTIENNLTLIEQIEREEGIR